MTKGVVSAARSISSMMVASVTLDSTVRLPGLPGRLAQALTGRFGPEAGHGGMSPKTRERSGYSADRRPRQENQRQENGQAIARFNRFVADDPRVEQVLIPIRDGLTIIKRK